MRPRAASSVRRAPLSEMIHLPYPGIACLIFALALGSGCNSKRASPAGEQPPLSSVAQEIQRRGYHVKESHVVPPTQWEISTLRMRYKRSFSFRAGQPQAGTRDYFVRFWFFEETYDSIEDARRRLANLHLPSPDATADVNEYDRIGTQGDYCTLPKSCTHNFRTSTSRRRSSRRAGDLH